MSNLILFGVTVLVIIHVAGSVLDVNAPGDFSVNAVVPGTNVLPAFCNGTPSEEGSNCLGISSNQFFARGAEAYVVSPMLHVEDNTKYRMQEISSRVGFVMGMTAGYYLVRISPNLNADIEDGSFVADISVVEAARIPVQVGAAQNNQGAVSWVLRGLDAVQDTVTTIIGYLTFDYPLVQGDAAPLVFIRYIITTFQTAFVILVIVYGVRLIRGAG